MKWIITAARKRKTRLMPQALAAELVDASNNQVWKDQPSLPLLHEIGLEGFAVELWMLTQLEWMCPL
jgi:hypothetical protein